MYISPEEECFLDDVLITPAHALTKQVNSHYLPKLLAHHPQSPTAEREVAARNRLLNIDGFGLAYYTTARSDFLSDVDGPAPVLYKSCQPPLHDLNFLSLAANESTFALLAHVRAATSTPTVQVNAHPFTFGTIAFVHNGTIGRFKAIQRELCNAIDDDAFEAITGSTDSEHFAALYITYLCKGTGKQSWNSKYSIAQMKEALTRATTTLLELQRKMFGAEAPANSLNGE